MYDADGELLYVGKAARLRDRVGSYFSSRALAPKVAALVRRIARIEVTVVNTETEALLLESNLIKAHRPRYNVVLRDDKSFPFILLDQRHEYPRLMFYRGARQRECRQFGPFPSAYAVKEVLQHLQKVFRIRNCRDSFFANRSRPCLQHQIGRCSAPCVGLIAREQYARDVQGAVGVLEGRNDEVIADLQQRMDSAAAALQFEDAARLRDQLRGLQEIRAQRLGADPRTAATSTWSRSRENPASTPSACCRCARGAISAPRAISPRARSASRPRRWPTSCCSTMRGSGRHPRC